MAFTSFQNQATSDATQVTQIIDALQGTAGQGQPIALTALSDAANYALDVRNQDATNGYCQRWLNAAGTAIGSVIGATVSYFSFLKKLVITIGTVTTGENHLAITATWNASGETFKGIFANITNTASHANSRLIDLQAGGTSKLNADVSGNTTIAGTLAVTGEVTLTAGLIWDDFPASGFCMGAAAVDRHVEGGSATIGSSGNSAVTFTNAYASTPNIVCAAQTQDYGDGYVSSTSGTGFTINNGRAEQHTFSWVAEGADA